MTQPPRRKRIKKKPNPTWGVLATLITTTIQELGPMTKAEICEHIDWDSESVSSVIARLRRPTKLLPQRLHISGWVTDHEGRRAYPRAQYALGAGVDAKRRKTPGRARADWQAMALTRMKMSSVFHMGLTRDQLRAQNREAPK